MLIQDHSSFLRLAILGSGKGTNAQALIEASRQSDLHYRPVLLVSDIADAGILKLGEKYGIPTQFFGPGDSAPFKTKFSEEREQELVELLVNAHIDFIALAGFMRVVKNPLLRAFPNRILNIHPSLLPHFPGKEAWRQAIDAGVHESGCTVHLVDHNIDTGAILRQMPVSVFQHDTPESLHVRIQQAEHELYPLVVDAFAKTVLQKK